MAFKKKLFSAAMAAGLVFGAANISNATNGYYMIATGAKSLGMAGAVVANPQDASTIIQNPAGIAWLRNTTFDIGAAAFVPKRKINGYDSDSNLYMIPSAGFAYNPMGCNCGTPHFVFGIGMYGVSGMGVDWYDKNGITSQLYKAWSNMAMMEMSVGGAYRVNDQLSIGFAPVFVYQAMGLEYDWKNGKVDSLDTTSAYGIGFDAGIVYKLNDMIQLGLVYKSERWMQKLEWNVSGSNNHYMIASNADKVKMKLNMPQQIALGINFRPIEPLRLEADVRWINYRHVMWEVPTTGMIRPTWNFHWHNQWVFAFGAEYQATKALTLRAGFNYAKSPIKDEDLVNNIVSPAIVETHATAGLSYSFTKNIGISMAYSHAFEHKQTGKDNGGQQPMTIKMHQDTVAFQLTYTF
ncbi:OmpP1/FadL family transporter [Hippea maritima]|uniref:Membrane protein involved in aromatic hydrocarbon degradation n=1 Tax=Hippea maritima (strain ATCC 700847 / DSM 10411 / MH2) TaxID=760142 RepID=F2LUS0_HIPMA|nr:outer membrane protein transport protein [Hippea maritima]AEA33525.1 membrane protein involved in aromatic hydrocarbon degradation [Hippea maritima DSM 10411]